MPVLEYIRLLQPVHLIAGVAAVLAWAKPDEAQYDLLDLTAVERRTANSIVMYARAVALVTQLKYHLFDTLRRPWPLKHLRPYFSPQTAATLT